MSKPPETPHHPEHSRMVKRLIKTFGLKEQIELAEKFGVPTQQISRLNKTGFAILATRIINALLEKIEILESDLNKVRSETKK